MSALMIAAVLSARALPEGAFSFTDDFNRANENLEASPNWTRVGGVAAALRVESNQVRLFSTTTTLYHCPDTGSTDHYAQAEIRLVSSANPGGIVVRAVDAINLFAVRYNSNLGEVQIYKIVAGTFFMVATAVFTCVVGDILRIEAIGSTVRALVNGVERVAPASTAGDFETSTLAGLVARGNTSNPWVDNFEAGEL